MLVSLSLLKGDGNILRRLRFVLPRSFSKSSLSVLLQRLIPTTHESFKPINELKESSEFSMPKLDCTIDQDVLRWNLMITKLGQEGRILQAQKLFDKIPDTDVITWTALISGYVRCGMVDEARLLFNRVDAKKDVVTWTAMINGYVKMKRISDAEWLFGAMPEKNVVSWNTMIEGYVKCGMADKALSLLERMGEPNVVSWNIVLAGLIQSSRIEEARQIFDRIPERNLVSWTVMIAGLSRNGRVDEARLLFERMPQRNVVSWNAMISGYTRNFRLDEAFDLFEKMPEKDVQSWNAMISGCIQNGDLKRANRLFNEMPEKNVVSWSSMINGYVQGSHSEEALRTFSDMLQEGRVRPNERTFSTVLVACSDLAALGTGKQIHQLISKTVHQWSDFVTSSLISMYSKCGEMPMARKVFDNEKTGTRDLVSWNGMIAAYAHHGCGKEAAELFQEILRKGLKPSDVTYIGLLAAFSRSGSVEEGFKHFEMLVNDKSVELRDDHFTCLIDLYGRAGRFKEAFDFIQQLPVKASVYVWGALLAGCNVHEDAERGKVATEKLLDAEPENSGFLTQLSNMYASSGKWNEAARLRKVMKDNGLKKQPGCSWIEVGSQVQVFSVGHESHSATMEIDYLVTTLHSKMKKADQILAENDSMVENGC